MASVTPVDLSGLSEEKIRDIGHFKDISGLSDNESARRLLEDSNWNLEQAVHSFMGLEDPSTHVRRRNVTENPPPIELHPDGQFIHRTRTAPTSWFKTFFSYLVSPIRIMYDVILGMIRLLVPYIWVDSRGQLTDAAGDVRAFIQSFRDTYVADPGPPVGDNQFVDGVERQASLPPFHEGSYGEVLQEAKSSLRFLIIYLHGDSHEDTDAFCRGTLLDSAVLAFLSNTEQVIFWGCNVNSVEGHRVSQILRENTYPFIGVVGLSANPTYSASSFGSSTRMALIGRIEGLISPAELVAQLQHVIDDHQAVIAAARVDRQERQLASQLRQEQDQAYEASLAADRAKAVEREAELARLANDARTEQRGEALAQARVRRQQRWARSLPQPPAAGTLDTVRLSIKLPNGERHQRIFSVKDSLKHLYYFAISKGAPDRFAIESNFPKLIIECNPADESDLEDYMVDEMSSSSPSNPSVNFTPGDADPPSFETAGLTKPELLFIIDLDS